MKKTIYIDWEEREVLTEKEFEELVNEERKRLVDTDEAFEEWLENNFSSLELWKMEMSERVKALTDYRRYCDKVARDNLLYEEDGYIEKFEIEV